MITSEKAKQLIPYGIIKVAYQNNVELYDCYMPFVDGGGLFIACEHNYQLGDELFLLIGLPKDNSTATFSVSGKVVWINDRQKMGKRVAGVGVQLTGDFAAACHQEIQKQLGKQMSASLSTATM